MAGKERRVVKTALLESDVSSVELSQVVSEKSRAIAFAKVVANPNGTSTIQFGGAPLLTFKYEERGIHACMIKILAASRFSKYGYKVRWRHTIEEDGVTVTPVFESAEDAQRFSTIFMQQVLDLIDNQAQIAARYFITNLEDELMRTLEKHAHLAITFSGEGASESEKQLFARSVLDNVKAWQGLEIRDVKERLKARGPGQHSQWTKDELERVVRGVLAILPTPRSRTYDKVTKILKGLYGDRAPESGEALRKMLDRFGLDWKKLKPDSII